MGLETMIIYKIVNMGEHNSLWAVATRSSVEQKSRRVHRMNLGVIFR
jgi:hypothetical protein